MQAQYFAAPLQHAEYLRDNIFLPDINQQLPTKKPEYKAHMVSLERLVLIKFTKVRRVEFFRHPRAASPLTLTW